MDKKHVYTEVIFDKVGNRHNTYDIAFTPLYAKTFQKDLFKNKRRQLVCEVSQSNNPTIKQSNNQTFKQTNIQTIKQDY